LHRARVRVRVRVRVVVRVRVRVVVREYGVPPRRLRQSPAFTISCP
jgi:hypothetical protein